MSRYASKQELVDTIRHTIEVDWNTTGLPTDPHAYNMTGVLRDLGIMGSRFEGWTVEALGRDEFAAALRRNLRRPHRAGR